MLTDLPLELLQHVYAQLDKPHDLRSMRLTCKYLNEAAEDPLILRNLHANIFDRTSCTDITVDDLLKARWELRRWKKSAQAGTAIKEWSILADLMIEMRHDGKNASFIRDISAVDLLYLAWSPDRAVSFLQSTRSKKASAQFLSLLLLACLPWSTASLNEHFGLSPSADAILEPSIAKVVFGTDKLFATDIVRETDGAIAHSSIAPAPFAGADCVSFPDFAVFAGILVLVHRAMVSGMFGESTTQHIHADLSAESAAIAPKRETVWSGVYIYLDYRVFQYLRSLDADEIDENTDVFDFEHCASDGIQSCKIIMENDGKVSGNGVGTYGRAHGGTYTIKGTWTRIQGLPPGYRRISWHKEYQNEQYRSNWLYDGLHIPGHTYPHKSLFLGRWKDDTARWSSDAQITGPFIFWQKG